MLLGLFGAPRSDLVPHSDSTPGELRPLAPLVMPMVIVLPVYHVAENSSVLILNR